MEKPEITEVVNTQMPLGATLGIRMFGGPDEVDATLEWAPGLCTERTNSGGFRRATTGCSAPAHKAAALPADRTRALTGPIPLPPQRQPMVARVLA